MKKILLLAAVFMFHLETHASKLAPRLKNEKNWQNGLDLSYVNIKDFVEGEFAVETLKLVFQNGEKKIVVLLDDVSKRYTRAQPVLSVTFVKNQSSKDLEHLPSGQISRPVDFVDGISWFLAKKEPTPKALTEIYERVAEALSGNAANSIWKSKELALKDLAQYKMTHSYEKLKLVKFVRDKGGSLGGVMEFEVFVDQKLKPIAARITNEVIVD